jgi:hypothetical protein
MSIHTLLDRPVLPESVASKRRGTVATRVIAVLVMLIGAALVALTLIVNLFSVGPAFERLTDGFRPVMTQQSIATAQQDITGLGAAGTEFQTTVAPALGAQLGMTPAQLGTMMNSQFPAVSAGMTALPTIVPTFQGLMTTLDQQRPLFTSADAIPTKNLPATTLPWALLAAGLIVFGLGVYAWFAPRAGAILALFVGGLLIVVPLLMSLPQKASDADQMNANLKPVYTQQMITQANAGLSTLTAMGTQMQTAMLPALATQLKMSPTQMQQFLAANFPKTGAALTNMPAAMHRFQVLTGTFKAHLNDYNTLKPVSLVPIVWFLIGSGVGLVLLGSAGIGVSRSRLTS